MKSLILGLFMSVISLSAIGQGAYASYKNSIDGTPYEVQVVTDRPSGYLIYINMMSVNPSAGKGGIIIGDSQLPNFLRAIEKAKIEFDSLSSDAKSKGLLEYEKVLNIKYNSRAYFQFGKTWNLHQLTPVKFIFKVVDGVSFLVIRTGYLTSFEDANKNHVGFAFVFFESDKISDLYNLLLPRKVLDYIEKYFNF